MRWLGILLGIVSPAAEADWYKFRPCGVEVVPEATLEGGWGIPLPDTGWKQAPAPNLTQIYWWIPPSAVVLVVEIRGKDGELSGCSYVAVNGDQWLVVGSAREIYDKFIKHRIRDIQVP